MELIALHGFLGSPRDWDGLAAALPAARVTAPALFEDPSLTSDDSMEQWAARFIGAIPRDGARRWLLGYSMGGRLAMHALVAAPELWAGAILVSCHPGLVDRAEKINRRARDGRWAARFLEEPWEDLMDAWDRQPIFGGRPTPFRRTEKEFFRGKLAAGLWAWSVGRQAALAGSLARLSVPIVWVSGEEDETYGAIGRRMGSELPSCRHARVHSAGHRAPWENAPAFHRVVEEALHWEGESSVARSLE